MSTLEEIRKDLGERESALMAKRSDLEDLDPAIEQMRFIGDYSAYNRMVADYNKKVREYNQELDTFNDNFRRIQPSCRTIQLHYRA